MYFKYTNRIAKNEIFPIGRLLKTHGLNGEMTFSTTTTLLDEIEIPYLILEPEGIAVQFFIEEVRMKSGETGLIKFEGIDSGEQAREYVGLTLYLPNEYLEEMDETDEEAGYFVGFEVMEENHGKIGTITDVDQSTENILFVIETDADEILIPAVEEYITDIDHEKKIIRLRLPDGLLDL